MKKRCFVHTGRGRSLCSRHRQAVIALAAKWHIDEETAVFELRDLEIAVDEKRIERAHELEAAIRTIRDHRALEASRRSTSRRKRARG
jgi:RPA family protein